MVAQAAIQTSVLSCPMCNGAVDVKSRHVVVAGGTVRIYCSAVCLTERDVVRAEPTTISIAQPRRSRRLLWLLAASLLAPTAIIWFTIDREREEVSAPPAPDISASSSPADPKTTAVGDPQADADNAVLAELMRDTWINPLAGPNRRMPRSHTGAFGAERGGGERPPECVSGHCGVDLGYVWGEPVFAVHEGVIDFVQRGPNDDKGGIYVRIAHRGGTLFSWYFHLAAVPRSLSVGDKITAGQLIGLLGDTGVKHSEPHLHFALSVKHSKHARERYLDPEPLIAIWPLWIPNENRIGGRLSTAAEPGMPVRANGRRRKVTPVDTHLPAAAGATPEEPNPPTGMID